MNPMKVKWYHSITVKIFVAVCLLLTAALFTSTAVNIYRSYNQLHLQAQERTLQEANASADYAKSTINSILSTLKVLAVSYGMQGGRSSDNATAQLMQQVLQLNKNAVGIGFFEMTAKQGITNRSFSFQKTSNNQLPRSQERLLQSLTQTMQSSLSPSKVMITAIRNNTSARTNKQQNLGIAIIMPFVVKDLGPNKGGQFLLATLWEPSVLIGRSSSTGNQNDILILGTDGTVLSHTFTYMGADWAFPREIADFHSIKVGSMFRKWRDARDLHIAAISAIPEYNLRTLTIGSGAFIDQEVLKQVQLALLWGLLLVLITMYMAVLLVRRQTRALTDMTSIAIRIAQGDFRPQIQVKTKDEIGLLGHAINYLASCISLHIRQRLDWAKLENEIATAKLVQESFFKSPDQKPEWLSLQGFHHPAEQCGGDWWGYYPVSHRFHFFCIADATGHGLPAALVTAMCYSLTTTLARMVSTHNNIKDMLPTLFKNMNQTFVNPGSKPFTMTYFACIFDSFTGELHYCNAGHNFPFLIPMDSKDARLPVKRRASNRRLNLAKGGAPFGIDINSDYAGQSIQVRPGDKILLYTDGVFENNNQKNQMYGKKKFYDLIDKLADYDPQQLTNQIQKDVFTFMGAAKPIDDITLLSIQIGKDWRPQSGETNHSSVQIDFAS